MNAVPEPALKIWRALVGDETMLERFLKRQYAAVKGKIERKQRGDNFIIFWSKPLRERRIGIYLKGSCDLVSILFCQPLIHRVLRGTCCIIREGLVSDSRSDLLLQTLQDFPSAWLEPVIERLRLPTDYFQPQLFDKCIRVRTEHSSEAFPKQVICLSIAADVTRTLYRHRHYGFLVDPGEWWLGQSLPTVLGDLPAVDWFAEHFVSIGKIGVDAFQDNMTKIIHHLKKNTGAHILVFNMLTDEVSGVNTQKLGRQAASQARRWEFNSALAELEQRLDFAMVDVDRILKSAGLGTRERPLHFPPERDEARAEEAFRLIAREVFGMLQQLGVV